MVIESTGPEPALEEAVSTSSASDTYLADFEKLGPQIFYLNARRGATADTETTAPDLNLICSWLYARNRHIAKYTDTYRKLFPTSSILLLKNDGPDLIWRPNAWQMEALKPAVRIIHDHEQSLSARSAKARVLLHVFSNGGSVSACQLSDAYRAQSGGRMLPVSTLVIDSAPSIPSLRVGLTAMSQGFPTYLPMPLKIAGGTIMYSCIYSLSFLSRLAGSEGAMTSMRRRLNDPEGAFMQSRLQRTYIYSNTDQLVPWQHVEAHAQEAREVLIQKLSAAEADELIKLEKFEGSKHVAHAVLDFERYWSIVQRSWRNVDKQGQGISAASSSQRA